MKKNKPGRSKHQFGLFLFFLTGLFALQIAFAFTTHGDIGPHRGIIPGIERPASPVLIGRIDSVISDLSIKSPVQVVPEAALAPATRDFGNSAMTIAKIDTELSNAETVVSVKKSEGDRFAEYQIRRGDTLEKISRKLFGSSKMVQPIVRINRIHDEKALKLGSTLKVPCNGLLTAVVID